MGAHLSTQNKGKARSDAIDRQIEGEASRNRNKASILLLGTDPNMSTIVKQMKIQHGLTNDELMNHRLTVYQNTFDSAQKLVRNIQDMDVQYADPMNQVRADQVLQYRIQHDPSFFLSPEITKAIHHLWEDSVGPKVMNTSLDKTAEYFIKEILRIGSPDYIPTDSDILHTRRSLAQLTETHFIFGEIQITIVDVGRAFPRRELHRFEDVTCIMFCASLSGYDNILQEDDCQNQLNDSLIDFESIVNSRRFLRPVIILLLTDIDMFKDKLSKVPLQKHFPHYPGSTDFNEAFGYIRWRFMQVNRANLPLHIIRYHPTDSTTPRAISKIVGGIILENAREDLRRTRSYSAAIRVLHLRRTLSLA